MKKKPILIFSASLLLLVASWLVVGQFGADFAGEVTDVSSSKVLVDFPGDSDWRGHDRIWVIPAEEPIVSKIKTGMKIKVWVDNPRNIMESYPAQIRARKVRIVSAKRN